MNGRNIVPTVIRPFFCELLNIKGKDVLRIIRRTNEWIQMRIKILTCCLYKVCPIKKFVFANLYLAWPRLAWVSLVLLHLIFKASRVKLWKEINLRQAKPSQTYGRLFSSQFFFGRGLFLTNCPFWGRLTISIENVAASGRQRI